MAALLELSKCQLLFTLASLPSKSYHKISDNNFAGHCRSMELKIISETFQKPENARQFIMEEGDMGLIVHQTTFRLTWSNFSKHLEFCSATFLVGGIPWFVQVRKRGSKTNPSLDIILNCAQSDDLLGWEYAATFAWKLLSASDNQVIRADNSSPCVFNRNKRIDVFDEFTDWCVLMDDENNLLTDDKIRFEISVAVADLHQLNSSTVTVTCVKKCCDNSCSTTLHLKVDNVSNLLAVHVPGITLMGSDGVVTIFKDIESCLGVGFHHTLPRKDAKYEVELHSRLMPFVSIPTLKKCVEKFDQYHTTLYNYQIIKWPDLFQPRYRFIVNGSITLEVKINLNVPECLKPGPTIRPPDSKIVGCTICLKIFGDQETSCPPCGHLFCSECIDEAVRNKNSCPTCNDEATLESLRRVHLATMEIEEEENFDLVPIF